MNDLPTNNTMLSEIHQLLKALQVKQKALDEEKEQQLQTFRIDNKQEIAVFCKFVNGHCQVKRLKNAKNARDFFRTSPSLADQLIRSAVDYELELKIGDIERQHLTLAYIANVILGLRTHDALVEYEVASWLCSEENARVVCQQSDFDKDYQRGYLDAELISEFQTIWKAKVNNNQ